MKKRNLIIFVCTVISFSGNTRVFEVSNHYVRDIVARQDIFLLFSIFSDTGMSTDFYA